MGKNKLSINCQSESFANIIKSYEDSSSDITNKLIYQPLSKHFVAGSNRFICDLGCGDGRFTTFFPASKENKVLAIDINTWLIDYAINRNIGNNIQFVVADICKNLPLKSCSIDSIFAIFTLSHIPNKYINTILLNVHNALTSGGSFIILNVHIQWIQEMYEVSYKEDCLQIEKKYKGNTWVEWYRQTKKWKKWLVNTGYDINEIEDIEIPIGNFSQRYAGKVGHPLYTVIHVSKP